MIDVNSRAYEQTGVVVIGRNEGARLVACFDSLPAGLAVVVYVDSGSTDGSLVEAERRGFVAISLDMSQPYSAARARNVGWQKALELEPALQFVQFVDGDCVLHLEWIERAGEFLCKNPHLAIVSGRLRERFPEASIYNRLMELGWELPVGEAKMCGGNALMRINALVEVDGFDPSMIAGEEPELCSRLRERGWRFWHLDEDMALHDAAMSHFRQWWKRSFRTGYGGYLVSHKRPHDPDHPYGRICRSSRNWVLMWPMLVTLISIVGFVTAGISGMFLGFAVAFVLFPLQVAKIAWRRYRTGSSLRISLAYAWLIMISKFAEFKGQLRAMRELRSGQRFTVIEHRSI